MVKTIFLLVLSNIFMTYAWYGHLKHFKDKALWVAILVSWSVAFFEYCLQVPANRIGSSYFTLPQLKILQEVITLVVFSLFCLVVMKVPLQRNFFYASLCMLLAVYFIFKEI
jgi:uncharacterized protein (DUF486 family)